MNYAIKTLLKQSELIKDAMETKQEEWDNTLIESAMDDEMFQTDIANYKLQLYELIEAIELLRKTGL